MPLLGPVATFSPTSVLEVLLLLLEERKSACCESSVCVNFLLTQCKSGFVVEFSTRLSAPVIFVTEISPLLAFGLRPTV